MTYTNIRSWDGYTDVLSKVGTPTTYFVDSKGKLIGEPVLGANPKQYKEKMEEYLSQAEQRRLRSAGWVGSPDP